MKIEDLCDPRRTIPAARVGGETHKVFRLGQTTRILLSCSERQVHPTMLLVFKLKPEEITCDFCKLL